MNPGTFRAVVQILKPSRVQDATGAYVDGWELVATRRAEKLEQPGTETFSAGQTVARVPTRFKMRWAPDFAVDSTMRIVCRERLYQVVTAIDESGRRLELIVTTDELLGEPPWQAST